MKPINTSYYDFEKLVTGGFVYVDKTAQIYELANACRRNWHAKM